MSGFRYDQVNALDTLKWHTSRQYIPSRISQYICGCHLKFVGLWVETNTAHTTSLRFNQRKSLTRNIYDKIALLRDLTASNSKILMRGRSLHSRSNRASKGGSQKAGLLETIVLENTVSKKSSSKARKVRKTDSFVTIVKKELQTYCNKQKVYNGLVNIYKNPAFLIACYEEIKGKPGNMTEGSIKGTLDGLTLNWFEDLGQKLAKGQFTFSPARRVMIPKASFAGKERPLGIREKIVQKALASVLEQI